MLRGFYQPGGALRRVTRNGVNRLFIRGGRIFRQGVGQLAYNGTPIPNIVGTNGVAITPINASLSFANNSGALYSKGGGWPSWLALNPTTGVITGTAQSNVNSASSFVIATRADETALTPNFTVTTP
jgi:hypothetical protein